MTESAIFSLDRLRVLFIHFSHFGAPRILVRFEQLNQAWHVWLACPDTLLSGNERHE
jgi:hypothetical protein